MTAGTPTLTEAAAAADASDILPGSSGAEVTGRSFAAARWVALASVGNVVLSFGVFLVLARLIAPAEFGMVAIAAVFIDILQIVARCGLPDAVVQRADLDEYFAATAFWVMLGTGVLCTVALAASAGPIAWIFDLPELRPVLCALSLCFVITAAGAIHEARLQRSFGFRKLALRAFGANLVGGAVALAMAYAGYGVWSLVVQRLVAATATTLLTWAASRWMPARRLDLAAARAQIAFGSRVFCTYLLLVLSIRSQEVIAAYFLSAADIGYLRLAWRCIDLVSQVAVIPLTTVGLTTYARLQDQPAELASAFHDFTQASTFVAVPAFFGMAAVAPTLIPFLFGDQWHEAAPVLRILALLAPEFVATSMLWMIFTALGRNGIALKLAGAQFGLGAVAAFVTAPFGLAALAAGHVARAYVFTPVIVTAVGRFVPVGNRQLARSLLPVTACAAAMAGLVLLVQNPIHAILGDRVGLFAAVGVGILAYAGLAQFFMRDAVRTALGYFLRRTG
ncbi:polysaccharide transporter, PST family [Methylobacterium phyllostachyos]|uniref:Polysaccharide transporter, PST family n=1 Tax=Methylobacterium phyllostachyos TaxID=582672 RepID=A0A1H0IJ70_9HYPH|nr:lipopolysaccharide biosynthesis protein [Methylobacterium phyllostachyos]SDO31509.1 polysaccharide transporter, PST family [Methylobacterium phyllostachyos]